MERGDVELPAPSEGDMRRGYLPYEEGDDANGGLGFSWWVVGGLFSACLPSWLWFFFFIFFFVANSKIRKERGFRFPNFMR